MLLKVLANQAQNLLLCRTGRRFQQCFRNEVAARASVAMPARSKRQVVVQWFFSRTNTLAKRLGESERALSKRVRVTFGIVEHHFLNGGIIPLRHIQHSSVSASDFAQLFWHLEI